jgi:diguanylate cyclase (GGDEF)-like protein
LNTVICLRPALPSVGTARIIDESASFRRAGSEVSFADSLKGSIVREKPASRLNTPAPTWRRQARRSERIGDAAADVEGARPAKSRSRAVAVRLAAEVERLAVELQASRERIANLEATLDIDPLTETLNRRGFERELKRSLAYVKRYGATAALIYLDLDDFKPVNDRHGHAAGDAVLKSIAAALSSRVRASDVVARIGGDEFAVLLWNISEPDARAKAAALEAAAYAAPVTWGSSTLAVAVSAGVTFCGPTDAAGEVLARADAAMYARKAQRRRAAAR